MATLYVTPSSEPKREERLHNRELFSRYMPGFMEFFLEAKATFGVHISGPITIHIPEKDLELVESLMDETKKLVK